MSADIEFDRILAALYEGPLETPPFQLFLAVMREQLDADLVTLVLRPPSLEDQSVMLVEGGSDSDLRSYSEGGFLVDPFVELPAGAVVSLQEYLSSDTLLASEFYRIIMEPQGWYDFLGVDLHDDSDMNVRFRAGRYRGAPVFSGHEKHIVTQLLPHLQRALRLHAQISRTERERAVYAGAVEQLRVATLILDERGRVLSVNEAASELVARKRGIGIHEGRVRLTDNASNSELNALFTAVREGNRSVGMHPPAVMRVPLKDDALGLVVRSLGPCEVAGTGTPSIALFVSDPSDTAEPPQQVVGRLYGLTPAEAGLAVLLAEGLSLDEASARLAVSRNTARAHLRAIFAKTGVTRQSGLVRLMLRSVAPLAAVEK